MMDEAEVAARSRPARLASTGKPIVRIALMFEKTNNDSGRRCEIWNGRSVPKPPKSQARESRRAR